MNYNDNHQRDNPVDPAVLAEVTATDSECPRDFPYSQEELRDLGIQSIEFCDAVPSDELMAQLDELEGKMGSPKIIYDENSRVKQLFYSPPSTQGDWFESAFSRNWALGIIKSRCADWPAQPNNPVLADQTFSNTRKTPGFAWSRIRALVKLIETALGSTWDSRDLALKELVDLPTIPDPKPPFLKTIPPDRIRKDLAIARRLASQVSEKDKARFQKAFMARAQRQRGAWIPADLRNAGAIFANTKGKPLVFSLLVYLLLDPSYEPSRRAFTHSYSELTRKWMSSYAHWMAAAWALGRTFGGKAGEKSGEYKVVCALFDKGNTQRQPVHQRNPRPTSAPGEILEWIFFSPQVDFDEWRTSHASCKRVVMALEDWIEHPHKDLVNLLLMAAFDEDDRPTCWIDWWSSAGTQLLLRKAWLLRKEVESPETIQWIEVIAGVVTSSLSAPLLKGSPVMTLFDADPAALSHCFNTYPAAKIIASSIANWLNNPTFDYKLTTLNRIITVVPVDQWLEQWATELPQRNRLIFRQRYQNSTSRCPTLSEVGSTLSLSRERVRQLELDIRNRLANTPGIYVLQHYSDQFNKWLHSRIQHDGRLSESYYKIPGAIRLWLETQCPSGCAPLEHWRKQNLECVELPYGVFWLSPQVAKIARNYGDWLPFIIRKQNYPLVLRSKLPDLPEGLDGFDFARVACETGLLRSIEGRYLVEGNEGGKCKHASRLHYLVSNKGQIVHVYDLQQGYADTYNQALSTKNIRRYLRFAPHLFVELDGDYVLALTDQLSSVSSFANPGFFSSTAVFEIASEPTPPVAEGIIRHAYECIDKHEEPSAMRDIQNYVHARMPQISRSGIPLALASIPYFTRPGPGVYGLARHLRCKSAEAMLSGRPMRQYVIARQFDDYEGLFPCWSNEMVDRWVQHYIDQWNTEQITAKEVQIFLCLIKETGDNTAINWLAKITNKPAAFIRSSLETTPITQYKEPRSLHTYEFTIDQLGKALLCVSLRGRATGVSVNLWNARQVEHSQGHAEVQLLSAIELMSAIDPHGGCTITVAGEQWLTDYLTQRFQGSEMQWDRGVGNRLLERVKRAGSSCTDDELAADLNTLAEQLDPESQAMGGLPEAHLESDAMTEELAVHEDIDQLIKALFG